MKFIKTVLLSTFIQIVLSQLVMIFTFTVIGNMELEGMEIVILTMIPTFLIMHTLLNTISYWPFYFTFKKLKSSRKAVYTAAVITGFIWSILFTLIDSGGIRNLFGRNTSILLILFFQAANYIILMLILARAFIYFNNPAPDPEAADILDRQL